MQSLIVKCKNWKATRVLPKSQQIYSTCQHVVDILDTLLAKNLYISCALVQRPLQTGPLLFLNLHFGNTKERENLDHSVHTPDYCSTIVLTCSLKCVSVSQSIHICSSFMHMVHGLKTQERGVNPPSPCAPYRPHRRDHRQPVDQNMNSMLASTAGRPWCQSSALGQTNVFLNDLRPPKNSFHLKCEWAGWKCSLTPWQK